MVFRIGVKFGVILRDGYRQRVFEERVLRKTLWADKGPGDSRLEETA